MQATEGKNVKSKKSRKIRMMIRRTTRCDCGKMDLRIDTTNLSLTYLPTILHLGNNIIYYQRQTGIKIFTLRNLCFYTRVLFASRNNVALQYVRGLCWVLRYYYQGCASWRWYFPYHYAPFASDFINIGGLSTEFEKGTEPVCNKYLMNYVLCIAFIYSIN